MNMRMLKTELYKIYSKRIIWIAMIVFLGLFLLFKVQFLETVGVKYTLEPMRSELSAAIENEEFHEFVRSKGYKCSVDDMEPFVPQSVFDYIEKYKDSERVYRTLISNLVSSINSYYERIDLREAYITELAADVAESDGTLMKTAQYTPASRRIPRRLAGNRLSYLRCGWHRMLLAMMHPPTMIPAC